MNHIQINTKDLIVTEITYVIAAGLGLLSLHGSIFAAPFNPLREV